jgi:predicted RND superfamily exporter protein
LKSNSPTDLADLHTIAKANCPATAAVVGQSDVYREASEVLSRTLSESFLVSLLIVIFIIFYLQRKLGNRHYFLLPLSLLGGPLFLVAGMAVFQIPISPFNSMFLAILVGITGDNAIQYLFSNEGGDLDQGLSENGPASIIIGLITVISSLLFLFQTLIPMKILGILFSIGFLVNLFGDLWILKGLLNLKDYLTKRSTAPNTGVAPTE